MKHSIRHILTYAGALPFVAGAAALWSGDAIAQEIGIMVLTSYGLLILSFVAGTHWGYVAREESCEEKHRLLISSNALALLAWLFYVMLEPMVMLPLFALLFSALLLVDYQLHLKAMVPSCYYRMRRWVSMVVILSIVAASLQSLFERREEVEEVERSSPSFIVPKVSPPEWYRKAKPNKEGTI